MKGCFFLARILDEAREQQLFLHIYFGYEFFYYFFFYENFKRKSSWRVVTSVYEYTWQHLCNGSDENIRRRNCRLWKLMESDILNVIKSGGWIRSRCLWEISRVFTFCFVAFYDLVTLFPSKRVVKGVNKFQMASNMIRKGRRYLKRMHFTFKGQWFAIDASWHKWKQLEKHIRPRPFKDHFKTTSPFDHKDVFSIIWGSRQLCHSPHIPMKSIFYS